MKGKGTTVILAAHVSGRQREDPRTLHVMDGVEEIVDGETVWRFERAFLRSHWTCIWGRGCLGILPDPAPQLGHGCCSHGADLDGDDEARMIGALAATLPAEHFEQHAEASSDGVFADGTHTSTRIVDGACIFLNRPDFAGGAGCALHVAALEAGEAPQDWKPSVCWQVPIRVEFAPTPDGTEIATVRRWTRSDWGDDSEAMGWWCTEDDLANVGDRPVVESLESELTEIAGPDVYVELRRRLR